VGVGIPTPISREEAAQKIGSTAQAISEFRLVKHRLRQKIATLDDGRRKLSEFGQFSRFTSRRTSHRSFPARVVAPGLRPTHSATAGCKAIPLAQRMLGQLPASLGPQQRNVELLSLPLLAVIEWKQVPWHSVGTGLGPTSQAKWTGVCPPGVCFAYMLGLNSKPECRAVSCMPPGNTSSLFRR
jgi:hypothetical protein